MVAVFFPLFVSSSLSHVLTVVLDLLRHVVVNYMLNGREIQTLGSYIRSHQNIFLPFLEGLDGFRSFLLV